MSRLRSVVLSIVLMLVSSVLPAQTEPGPAVSLRIVPTSPKAGELVTLVIEYGGCAFPTAGTETVTVSGTVVTFSQLVPFPVCGVPPPGPQIGYPLGAFPAGNYTLVYAPRGDLPGGVWGTAQLGFSVGANPVPSISHGFALWFLASSFALIAFIRLSRSRGIR